MSESAGHGIDAHVLRDVLVFLLAALVAVPLFARLKISPVLGYLVAGVVIGPAGLALVRSEAGTSALAELGIVFLLFTVGLELSLERLRALARLVFGFGGLQVLITGFAIGVLSYAIYPDPAVALVVGGGLALSSTAVVLQLLTERREMATGFGRASFAVLLLQDLAVVPLLVVLPLLAGEAAMLSALGEAGLRAVVAIAAIAAVGRLALRPLYRIVAAAGSPELFAGMTLLAVLATAWAAAQAGLSMALGAFLAGLLLAETEFRHQVEIDIAPFKGLLLGLFFITVGMTIDLAVVVSQVGLLVAGVALLMVLKAAIVAALAAVLRLPPTAMLRSAVLLAQGGEFGFVVFGLAVGSDLLPGSVAQLLIAGVVLSMALTPLLHAATERLAVRLAARRPPETDRLATVAAELHDHVVIAGFGRVGQTVATLLGNQGIPFVALDLDARSVRDGVARGLPVFFGDSRRPEILHAAAIERASAAVVTLDNPTAAIHLLGELRSVAPELPVIVRARDRAHADRLEAAGATVVVPEMLEASLQLSALVLESTGMSAADAAGVVAGVRAEHYSPIEGTPLVDKPAAGEAKRDG